MDVLDEHTLMTEGSKNRLNYAGAMVTTKSENSEIPQDKVLPSDTWYIATINAMARGVAIKDNSRFIKSRRYCV